MQFYDVAYLQPTLPGHGQDLVDMPSTTGNAHLWSHNTTIVGL